MSGDTTVTAMILAAGVLLAGLSSVPAAEPPAALAEPVHTEKAEAEASTARAKACPAWWLTTDDYPKPRKTQKGKTGPTPEHKKKSSMHKPPPKSLRR